MDFNASRSSFTEAVPLALSSMAHMTIPLDNGVLDGLREVVQHTLISSVNFARKSQSKNWELSDLYVKDWNAYKRERPKDMPIALAKLGFQHQYVQEVYICVGQDDKSNTAAEKPEDAEMTTDDDDEGWLSQKQIQARICLNFASQELLTEEELVDELDDDDDVPTAILYQVMVAYRSLPPTGKQEATEAEELSMLSFGASVDDAVKYGALASLYDQHAKYVMEICSVRGRRYKFDLMDATLSDGRVPHLEIPGDPPFVKSLCVTVTEHPFQDSLTRLSLTLDGNLKRGKNLDNLPRMHVYARKLEECFLTWLKPTTVLALPSRQSLLVDAELAGNVFVNGRYMTTWGEDNKIGTHVKALFGMDLHSIPVWHGRIVDYDLLKKEYANLWQEILIDARLIGLNLANILLYRLIYGKNADDGYDDEDPDVNNDCLESQVMSSTKFDPVGICAKALATRFSLEFGKAAFPCLQQEVTSVKHFLGHRLPVVVPARLISVLRRGGYFDLERTHEELWFFSDANHRPASTPAEHELLRQACDMLAPITEEGILPAHIIFVKLDDDPNPEKHNNLCRYHELLKQFYVNDKLATSTPFRVAHAIAKVHPDGDVEHKLLAQVVGTQ